MLRVFHAGPWPAVGGEVTLDSSESSHLIRVRRARLGEAVELLDGQGRIASAVVAVVDAVAAVLKIVKSEQKPARPHLMLAVGIPKSELLRDIVAQAAELGASEVQPLFTARTEVRYEGIKLRNKMTRLRATAIESCKQSGNPWATIVSEPIELAKWLDALKHQTQYTRYVAALTPNAVPLSSARATAANLPALIAIGPEGDFTPEEYTRFRSAGFTAVSLPGYVLRVETACTVALAILQSH